MLVTGSFPEQAGAWDNCHVLSDNKVNSSITCMPQVFKDAGYNTSYFGKVHWEKTRPLFDKKGTYIGSKNAPGGKYVNRFDTYVPPGKDRIGIEYYFHTLKDDHFRPLIYSSDPALIDGKKDGEQYRKKERQFSSKTELDAITSYLDNKRAQRDSSKPFFMMWSLNPPHPPYGLKDNTYMDTYNKYYSPSKIKDIKTLFNRKNAVPKAFPNVREYFSNVTAVDLFIGQFLDYLEKNNLADNTIVVFSTDHGEMLGSHKLRNKDVPYIEATNIPFLIRWPKMLKPRVDNLILSVPDMMPTLLGLANIEAPTTVQGRNLSKELINSDYKKAERPKYAPYFLQSSLWWTKPSKVPNLRSRGVYSGDFTLIIETVEEKLTDKYIYNNKLDPYQLKKESFDKYPKQSAEMLQYLGKLLTNTNDPWYQNRILSDLIPYSNK